MSYKKKEDVKNIPDLIIDPTTKVTWTKGKFLGKGGFARCFEFSDPLSRKVYAGKIVAKSLLVREHQKQKMSQEIAIHRSLNHKNIVGFHHFFEDSDNVYIILELCRRRSLMELHKRRKAITEPETRYFLRHLLNGVKHLHDNQVIHRDLKLGNLFINDDMELKIGDFGLATRVAVVGERKRTLCGTPNYIAPEILCKKGHSYEVDIWSIGCILYTLLIGRPPFETMTLKDTYNKIKNNDYHVPIYIGPLARALIQNLLQEDPSKRPTVDEILNDDFMTMGFIPNRLPTSCLTMAPRFDAHLNGSIVATRKPLLEINTKGCKVGDGEGSVCHNRRCSKRFCKFHVKGNIGKKPWKPLAIATHSDSTVSTQNNAMIFDSTSKPELLTIDTFDDHVEFCKIVEPCDTPLRGKLGDGTMDDVPIMRSENACEVSPMSQLCSECSTEYPKYFRKEAELSVVIRNTSQHNEANSYGMLCSLMDGKAKDTSLYKSTLSLESQHDIRCSDTYSMQDKKSECHTNVSKRTTSFILPSGMELEDCNSAENFVESATPGFGLLLESSKLSYLCKSNLGKRKFLNQIPAYKRLKVNGFSLPVNGPFDIYSTLSIISFDCKVFNFSKNFAGVCSVGFSNFVDSNKVEMVSFGNRSDPLIELEVHRVKNRPDFRVTAIEKYQTANELVSFENRDDALIELEPYKVKNQPDFRDRAIKNCQTAQEISGMEYSEDRYLSQDEKVVLNDSVQKARLNRPTKGECFESSFNIDLEKYDCDSLRNMLFEGGDPFLEYFEDISLHVAEEVVELSRETRDQRDFLVGEEEQVQPTAKGKPSDPAFSVCAFMVPNFLEASSSSIVTPSYSGSLINPVCLSVHFPNIKFVEINGFDCRFLSVIMPDQVLAAFRHSEYKADARETLSFHPIPHPPFFGKGRRRKTRSRKPLWEVAKGFRALSKKKNFHRPPLILKLKKVRPA